MSKEIGFQQWETNGPKCIIEYKNDTQKEQYFPNQNIMTYSHVLWVTSLIIP